MKCIITVKNTKTDHQWTETYTPNCSTQEEATKYFNDMISYFNETIRPGESPRQLVSIEITSEKNTEHDWQKMSYGMSSTFRGQIADIFRCSKCQITGKRFGLNSKIKIDSKYKGKVFKICTHETIIAAGKR